MKRPVLYWFIFLALFFKDAGAAWDASFHFKYLRDLNQAPHILNFIGNMLLFGLVFFLWRLEPKNARRPLKVILSGIFLFLVAIPIDDFYHRIHGIDLTTWSPTHFMLYAGTFLEILGCILLVQNDHGRKLTTDKTRKFFLLGLLYLFLSNTWFPLLQQEQGAIAVYLFSIGKPLASQELLAQVHNSTRAIFGGIPDWVYAAYASLASMFVFRLIKDFRLAKYSATIISIVYLAFRLAMNTIFALVAYQTSAIPYFLPVLGILFDVTFIYAGQKSDKFQKIFTLSILMAVVIHAFSLINKIPPAHPPMPFAYIWLSMLAGVVGYYGAIGFGKITKNSH
jgi:hypothetical protein